MITHFDPRGRAAESFRSLGKRLQLVGTRDASHAPRTIFVTSPGRGDGRSLCAVNLAVALAQSGRSVLLIDADLGNPSLSTLLDLQDGNGLLDVLDAPQLLRWSIQPSGLHGLDVLPGSAAARQAEPRKRIDRFRLRATLAARTGEHDHIIFDGPAVNPAADATVLAGECDATLLVVRAGQTSRRSVGTAFDAISVVGARAAGVIVNAAPMGRRYGVHPVAASNNSLGEMLTDGLPDGATVA
jgi:receptor protein-tyrosine kinase